MSNAAVRSDWSPRVSSTSPVLAWTVAVAVVGLAGAGFAISFNALRELAIASAVPSSLAFLWPLIVDGFIVVATLAAWSLRDRGWTVTWYPWLALTVFAAVSVAGNALHVSLESTPLGVPVAVAVAVSSMPAVALLVASHLLVVMMGSGGQEAGHATVKAEAPPVATAALVEAERPVSAVVTSISPVPVTAPAAAAGVVVEAVGRPVAAPEVVVDTAPSEAHALDMPPALSGFEVIDPEAAEASANVDLTGVSEPAQSLIEWAAERGELLTARVAADVLGVSERTGRRRLAEVRGVRPELVVSS